MPSWIVHLATATEVIKRVNIKNQNNFLIGNLIPDAKRHVIKDFSICIPYHISHFSEIQKIDGKIEELPKIEKFLENYKEYLPNNNVVLGYLIHLLTDYYWNKTTYFRYTIRDDNGNCIGIKLNDGTKIKCNIEERTKIKHNDFKIFSNYIEENENYIIPKIESNLMNELKIIKEVPFIYEDIEKIIAYFKNNNRNKITEKEYKLFTLKQLKEDYEESINFIVNYLESWRLK